MRGNRNKLSDIGLMGITDLGGGVYIMKLKSRMLSLPALALVGLLGTGVGSASAQSIYVETFAEPFPVVEPYPVVVAPRYVVRRAIVSRPIVRERTIVVPSYVPGPMLAPPYPYIEADW